MSPLSNVVLGFSKLAPRFCILQTLHIKEQQKHHTHKKANIKHSNKSVQWGSHVQVTHIFYNPIDNGGLLAMSSAGFTDLL
jgi:hypothetical protein